LPIHRTPAAREALIMKLLPIVVRVSAAWGNTIDAHEEAGGDAALRLVELVDSTTDDDLLTPSYVAEAIRNGLRSGGRRLVAGSRIPSSKLLRLDAPIAVGEDGQVITGHDLIADPRSQALVTAGVDRRDLDRALRQLPWRQRIIVAAHAGLNPGGARTLTDVANELDISKMTASREYKLGMAALRETLGVTVKAIKEAKHAA
jgi:hypothetical protein